MTGGGPVTGGDPVGGESVRGGDPVTGGGPVTGGDSVDGGGPVRIVAPLLVEALAVRGARVGMRARRPPPPGPLLLAGIGGAVVLGLAPGDLVVADRVLDGPELAGAEQLAKQLQAAGLTVHVGPVGGADTVVTGAARQVWAARGALAVDMESGVLARTGRLAAVVRAIVDTPIHPLVSLGTLPRSIAALRTLRRAAPVLSAWAAGPGARDVGERQAAHAETPVTLPEEVENS